MWWLFLLEQMTGIMNKNSTASNLRVQSAPLGIYIFRGSAACARFLATVICANKKSHRVVALFVGADDGNRTRVFGLGSGHSAIELHLQARANIV